MAQHYITTHNPTGQAIFSTKIPTAPHKIPVTPSGNIEDGYMQVIYATNAFKPDLSTENDIDEYALMRTQGMPSGVICPPNGAATLLLVLAPGHDGASMHRTMTLDVLVVLQGAVELTLDSGEARVMREGDTVVQRGTMHTWKNVTPNGGMLKMLATVLPIHEPLKVGTREVTAQM